MIDKKLAMIIKSSDAWSEVWQQKFPVFHANSECHFLKCFTASKRIYLPAFVRPISRILSNIACPITTKILFDIHAYLPGLIIWNLSFNSFIRGRNISYETPKPGIIRSIGNPILPKLLKTMKFYI